MAGRPHAYFAISILDFELFFSLADHVISTSYHVHISGKAFELDLYPGIWSISIPDPRVSIDCRT